MDMEFFEVPHTFQHINIREMNIFKLVDYMIF